MKRLVFINRRRGGDRRQKNSRNDPQQREHPFLKRRRNLDRRDPNKTLTDDYYAYMQKTIESIQSRLHSKKTKPKN